MKASDPFVKWASSRIILRRVEEYGLPSALLTSIGTEEDNLALLEALEAFMGTEGSFVS